MFNERSRNVDFNTFISAPVVSIGNSPKSGLTLPFVRTMYEYTLTVQYRAVGEKLEDDQSEQQRVIVL